MGEFFQQVHVWVVKNCTPWYMDGPDLIYRGTWMGHFSFRIGTWMGDGWWHFKIPRGTPLPRPKLSTPPRVSAKGKQGVNFVKGCENPDVCILLHLICALQIFLILQLIIILWLRSRWLQDFSMHNDPQQVWLFYNYQLGFLQLYWWEPTVARMEF